MAGGCGRPSHDYRIADRAPGRAGQGRGQGRGQGWGEGGAEGGRDETSSLPLFSLLPSHPPTPATCPPPPFALPPATASNHETLESTSSRQTDYLQGGLGLKCIHFFQYIFFLLFENWFVTSRLFFFPSFCIVAEAFLRIAKPLSFGAPSKKCDVILTFFRALSIFCRNVSSFLNGSSLH